MPTPDGCDDPVWVACCQRHTEERLALVWRATSRIGNLFAGRRTVLGGLLDMLLRAIAITADGGHAHAVFGPYEDVDGLSYADRNPHTGICTGGGAGKTRCPATTEYFPILVEQPPTVIITVQVPPQSSTSKNIMHR